MGTVVGDVNNDGYDEIICSGNSRTVAIKGTGQLRWEDQLLWNVTTPGVANTTQPQMADMDNDGTLEIVVPILGPPAGFHILDGRDGSIEQTVIPNPWGGRADNGPVIADTDGDGYPVLFWGSMTFVEVTDESNSTGRLVSYKYNMGGTPRYRELRRVKLWHPCSGGLTLADADHDGQFELYMGDRDMYMGATTDRGYGGGVVSYWASNLTERWRRPDAMVSSHKPMLADVTGDNVLDVIVTLQRGGLAILNSKDGSPIRFVQTVVSSNGKRVSGHYQSSVYDIDHDGNLEILMADGDHDITHDLVVWDLIDWREDARVPSSILNSSYPYTYPGFTGVGQMLLGPQEGDVTGDGVMDIVATNYTNLFVFDGSHNPGSDATYPVYWMSENLTSRDDARTGDFDEARAEALIYPVMKDIDSDGYVEIVVVSQGSRVYVFGTHAIERSTPRAEVQFYSEMRLGAAEYVPPPTRSQVPIVSAPSPNDWAKLVPVNTSQLSFNLTEYDTSTLMSYTVTTNPNIGWGTGTDLGNGKNVVNVGGLQYSTTYTWHLTVVAGTRSTDKTYTFTTEPVPTANTPPTQGVPLIRNSGSDLVARNQSTYDHDGDAVTNIYRWMRNGASTTNLLMPFDTRSQLIVKDYSGYGNNGMIHGDVSWVSDGAVGGAYEFNSGYIEIRDSKTLDGNYTWSEMSAEAWVYLSEGQTDTRILFKQPVYELGIKSSKFFATVWTPQVDYKNDTVATFAQVFSGQLQTGRWYHVAFTYRSGSEGLRLYVDGHRVASTPHSGYIQRSVQPLYIGWFSYFKGIIDEVQIYPKRLTAEQILQDYQQSRYGLSTTSTIVSEEMQSGDTWICHVIPNDGLADGINPIDDVTPPETTDNFDSLWHNNDFTIMLAALDAPENRTGVWRTYYILNGGTPTVLGNDYLVYVTTEGVNNTLEYWSVDIAGNEEIPHNILAGIKLDKTPPQGSFTINNEAGYANSTSVNLSLNASDALTGVNQVRYGNDGVWDIEEWELYLTTKAWEMTSGDGGKTIYCQVRDGANNTKTLQATIVLDTALPRGSIVINAVDQMYTTKPTVTLHLTYSDATSGVDTVRYRDTGTSVWGVWEAPSSSKAWILGVGDGNRTVEYQIRDKAGLISIVYTDSIILDTAGPTGSVVINNGVAGTNGTGVALSIDASDLGTGVAKMRLSNDNVTFTQWESFNGSKPWILLGGDGIKTVYVQFMDKAGFSSAIYGDTIIIDTVMPTANVGANQTVWQHTIVTFNASGSTDDRGIGSYTWTFVDGSMKILSGMKPQYRFSNPGTYNVILSVKDIVGNTATQGFTVTVEKSFWPYPLEGGNSPTNVLMRVVMPLAVAGVAVTVATGLFVKRRSSQRRSSLSPEPTD